MTSPATDDQGTTSPLPAPAAPPPQEAPPAPRWRRGPVLPRAMVMLVGAGAAVLVLAGLRAVAWLIGPAFLALMIVIALSPVQSWLRRHGWPGWLTTLVLVLLAVGVLVVFGLVVVVSLAKLATLLQDDAGRSQDLQDSLASSLTRFGVQPEQLQDALSTVNPAKVVAGIGALLAGLAAAVSSLVFLL